MTMTAELSVVHDTPTGALALRSDQTDWTPVQRAALAQIGVAEAPQADQVVLLHVAQRTGLDPFAKQIYMIGRNDRDSGGKKWTIQTGIDGFRIIAERNRQYAGQTEPQWCGPDGAWRDVWLEDRAPAAARIGVYRHDWAKPVYATVLFREFNGGNHMWRSKGAHMIMKVAEAHALRKAFPQDLSGLYTDDEMAQADHGGSFHRPSSEPAETVTADELRGTGSAAQAPAEPVQETTAPKPAAPSGTGRMSAQQQKQVLELLRQNDEIPNRNDYLSQVLGRTVTSLGQLSADDAAKVIDNLEGLAGADDEPAPESADDRTDEQEAMEAEIIEDGEKP